MEQAFGGFIEIIQPQRVFFRKGMCKLVLPNSEEDVECYLFNDLLVMGDVLTTTLGSKSLQYRDNMALRAKTNTSAYDALLMTSSKDSTSRSNR